jgi:hypothetical protein
MNPTSGISLGVIVHNDRGDARRIEKARQIVSGLAEHRGGDSGGILQVHQSSVSQVRHQALLSQDVEALQDLRGFGYDSLFYHRFECSSKVIQSV